MEGSEHNMEADVGIVGAGSAGSAVALQCARRGMEVVCIERRRLARAGARWINNVPVWTFDDADIDRPTPPELLGDTVPMHLVAGFGRGRIVLDELQLLEVDMRRFVDRLQTRASSLGVRFVGGVDVEHFDGERLRTSAGVISARWFVDASGIGGAGLIDTPGPPRDHICAAAQQARRITDPNGARRYFDARDVPYGHTLCYTSIYGGYSVLNLRAHEDDQIHILTGSIPADGNPAGRHILAEFVDRNRHWIGGEIFGGCAPIPLGPPARRLADGKVALVGDAARQVLPTHGSGVGAGLVAAKLLADELADGDGVEGYARKWHKRYGWLFAAYEMFRRFSVELSAEDLAQMMEAGLLAPKTAARSLEQTVPTPGGFSLPRPAALIRRPGLALQFGTTLVDMIRAALLYRRYPDDPKQFARWSRRVERLFGLDFV